MFLLIDKPKGITSHDVVDAVRKITGEKRVGHAGTLDPNATGLLIVGVERESTKKLGGIAKDTSKTYEAEVVLGEERDTHDPEGRKIPNSLPRRQAGKFQIPKKFKLTKNKITDTLEGFLGEQMQVPPVYSAVKIKGKAAYKRARQGEKVKLKPKKVVIHSIKLQAYKFPYLKIKTEVSSGTYIRALARDIGRELGCGAYLKNLRRTKVGEYDVMDAVELKNLTKENWREFVIEL